jgi:Flp pilus assembly pilin Flp
VTGEYSIVLSLLIIGIFATISLLGGAVHDLFQAVLAAIP